MNPIYLLRLSALAERKEFVVHILVCARNHTCGNLVIRSSYFKRLEIKVSKVCPGGNVM